MRRLGRYKAESHREALEAHLALESEQRLIAALEIAVAGPFLAYAGVEDDPAPFYDRARGLGLYRP
jgi:hypothetical protein